MDTDRLAYLREKLATDSAILDLQIYSNRAGRDGWRSIAQIRDETFAPLRQNIYDAMEYLTLTGRLETDPKDPMRFRVKK